MMESPNGSPSMRVTESEDIEYLNFRVTIDGLPTGLLIKAETEAGAWRQLAIAAQRLDFTFNRSKVELNLME